MFRKATLLPQQTRNLHYKGFDPKDPKLKEYVGKFLLYPKEDFPAKEVIYNGPLVLKSAYVLDRLPRLLPDVHPAFFNFFSFFFVNWLV